MDNWILLGMADSELDAAPNILFREGFSSQREEDLDRLFFRRFCLLLDPEGPFMDNSPVAPSEARLASADMVSLSCIANKMIQNQVIRKNKLFLRTQR